MDQITGEAWKPRMTTYVYICSAAHSGSTLLTMLLGAHPNVAALGEMRYLPRNLALNNPCSCGLPVRSCSVWRDIINQVGAEIGTDLEASPYALNLGFIKAVNRIDPSHQTPMRMLLRFVASAGELTRLRLGLHRWTPALPPFGAVTANRIRAYDAAARVLGVQAVVDSSKHYLEAINLYRRAPKQTRIILLTRDGRAVFYSGLKRNFGPKQSLRAWQRSYRRAIPLLHRCVGEEALLTVKYERLAEESEAVLRELCQFLDLPYAPEMLRFGECEQHINDGNDMRFRRTSEIRLDTSWRTRLLAADRAYFEARAGALNRALGYQ